MKILVSLPSEQIRIGIRSSSEYLHRIEQSTSHLENHREFAKAWLQGFNYGVEAALASYKPDEAKARLQVIDKICEEFQELKRNAELDLKSACSTKKYYEGENTNETELYE